MLVLQRKNVKFGRGWWALHLVETEIHPSVSLGVQQLQAAPH